ncbi:peptidoglycan DD-metalloendopeptidase family protein [Marinicella sp. S1101]|uniref:peptidoglycan DD-metalloendopeptidase family protein n=1 Tax=Marinicella marina TaxID=2996016 RepID=UPI002260D945|nr:peptidoglycan DD-metalloendopeptidase family protein [Marinicella marina]MCX7553496.1 peptidoglycan DD-metalloendopeptidase family protein [Marinicella marina]MDJ1140120.1 peptidoglycan DD-metalloendopeptidase family protein [Marinicella marina]
MPIKAQAIRKNSQTKKLSIQYPQIKNFLTSLTTPKKVLAVLAVLFVLYAITDIISVDADAHTNIDFDSVRQSQMVPIPPTPLMSFAESGLIGSEQFINKVVTVKKGQTLSGIFTDLGLSQGLLLKIAHFNEDSKKLVKVMPGNDISFTMNQAGDLVQLRYQSSPFEELVIHNDMDQISTELIQHDQQIRLVSAEGTIQNSLFGAGKAAGLTDNMVMQLANIFSWDIDFVLEIRSGDAFSVIYEKIYKDGEYLTDGKILAASFTNQGTKFEAVYYEHEDGEGSYYAADGRAMKKAFLRAPLNFSYISSNFNPKRLHPVTKRVKAHRGIDYSAPVGTPVYAAGNGRVTRSGYNKYNGNYVFIQHPNGIITKYLHFSKRAVKKGQKVKQGQTIGYVGATGMVTGAHLHYEFIYNGVHRNPRTVSLPKSKPLPDTVMPEFLTYSTPLLSRLSDLKEQLVAMN